MYYCLFGFFSVVCSLGFHFVYVLCIHGEKLTGLVIGNVFLCGSVRCVHFLCLYQVMSPLICLVVLYVLQISIRCPLDEAGLVVRMFVCWINSLPVLNH